MTAKAYNAGTIFLQVVPVFGNVMKDISREAKSANKALGDEMEKGGRDAGRRASKAMGEEVTKGASKHGEAYAGEFRRQVSDGITKMQRELKPIKINVERNELRKDFAEIKRELDSLGKAKIGVDLDAATALARLEAIQGALRTLQHSAKNIEVKTNVDEAAKGVDRLIARIEAAKPVIEIKADLKQPERAMGAFEKKMKASAKRAADALGDSFDREAAKIKARLDAIGDMEIGIDIQSADAMREILSIESALAALSAEKVDIGIDVDVLAALGELEAFAAAVDKVERDDVDVKVELHGLARVTAGLAALRSNMKGTESDGVASANAFRSFSFIILGLATILPALIPMIAALGGALVALLPILAAVGSGVGVMILGFSGIGNAVSALGNQAKNGAKEAQTAAKRIKSAARTVADAERGLARARQSAARSSADAARAVADAERSAAQQVEDALERHRDAVRSLADAQRDARDAELGLMEARREAQQDLEDIADKKRQNALDIREAQVALFEAQVEYDAAIADPGATNLEKEKASINLGQAKERLHELREETTALDEQAKKGVDGSDRVQSAQDQLTAALERQRDAQRAVGDAAREVDQARIDGARMVQDALRNQGRVQADNAQSIADAQRNLRQANEDYRAAMTEVTASAFAVQSAMAALGPAGRKFALFIHGLRDEFHGLRDAAQAGMLPGVQEAIETILGRYGPGLRKFVGEMGTVMGDLFRRFGKLLTSPVFEEFFGMMADIGPKLMRQFGKTGQNWLAIFARLLTIAAPWAEKFSEALLKISENVLGFMKSKKGTKVIEDFMGFVEKVGPKVWEFFKNLWGAIVNIGKALAPLGALILGALDGILKLIANMNPRVLGAIVTGIITLVIAFQAMVGLLALVSAGATIVAAIMAGGFVAGLLIAVGVVILIVGALVILYTQSETARNIINAAFRAIGKAAKWLWEKAIKPAFEFIWDIVKIVFQGIVWTWKNVLWPVIKTIAKVIGWLWTNVFKPVLGFIWQAWKFMAKMIQGFYKNIIWPVLDLLITAIWKLLWIGVVKPALGFIIALWKEMSAEFMFGWKHYIKPAFDKLVEGLAFVKDRFMVQVENIGRIWASLKDALAEPVRFMIESVINKGIIGSFNKLARFVGSKEIPEVPLPDWTRQGSYNSAAGAGGSNAGGGRGQINMATGGVLPGYTPGVDVHHFASPTGGRLALSGGEAIMRPEWTNAMGPGYVEEMNRIARAKGSSGVRKAMGFAKGGVFWPTDFRSLSADYPGHTGVDISIPGTSDYGHPVFAAAAGMARAYWAGGDSYGNLVRIDHGGYETLYGHLAQPGYSGPVKGGQQIGNIGSTGNSSGPHLHFEVRPGETRAAALAYLGGASTPTGGEEGSGFFSKIAGWAKKAVHKPFEWISDRVSDSFEALAGNPFGSLLIGVGKKLLGNVADFVTGGGDGGADEGGAAGFGGPEAAYALGGVYSSLKNNGTMMYDNGGMLPPGLTNVVNLTGKPEPVFTSEQFAHLGSGSGGGGLTYAPHFEGSDLTAEDVADDLMFALRAIDHGGKYAGRRP